MKEVLNDYEQHVFSFILKLENSGFIFKSKVACNAIVCQNITVLFSFSKYTIPQPSVKQLPSIWHGFSAKPPEEWQFHLSLTWVFWAHSKQKLRECHDTAEQSKYLHNPWRPTSTKFKTDLLCAAASGWHLYICDRHKQVRFATHVPSISLPASPCGDKVCGGSCARARTRVMACGGVLWYQKS